VVKETVARGTWKAQIVDAFLHIWFKVLNLVKRLNLGRGIQLKALLKKMFLFCGAWAQRGLWPVLCWGL